jgi:hypothetical protein
MLKHRAPKLVTIAIFTTITVIFWVFFGVYRVLTSEPNPNVPPEILSPLNPTLDTTALLKLDDKIYFEEGQATIYIPPDIVETEEEEEVIEVTIEETTPASPSSELDAL